MNPPVFFASALLALAPAMPAQCLVSISGDASSGSFRDLTIGQLVDASELLAHPGWQPAPDARPAFAPDFQDPDALLFCDFAPLVPREAPRTLLPLTVESGPALSLPSPEPMPSPPDPAPSPAGGTVLTCSAADPEPAIVAGALPGTEAPPADPIPEPSAIVLLLGAAAWILLRRKH